MSIILQAADFARKKHEGQNRDSGEPYITHPAQVAQIISIVCPDDEELIAAAWLHDTLEDTATTYEEIEKEFGKRVADLVFELTHEGTKDSGYYFPRLGTRDAILIKFADRLCNLSGMSTWSEQRKEAYLKKSKFWQNTKTGMTKWQ